jgi:hypothetical protein
MCHLKIVTGVSLCIHCSSSLVSCNLFFVVGVGLWKFKSNHRLYLSTNLYAWGPIVHLIWACWNSYMCSKFCSTLTIVYKFKWIIQETRIVSYEKYHNSSSLILYPHQNIKSYSFKTAAFIHVKKLHFVMLQRKQYLQ